MEPNRLAPDTVNNAPTIGDNSPQAHASVQDRAGLYIAIVALIIATLSLGMQLTQGQLLDSKIAAAVAVASADIAATVAVASAGMEERLAETKQIANTAREHGRIALSEVERANAELAAKGLIRKAEH